MGSITNDAGMKRVFQSGSRSGGKGPLVFFEIRLQPTMKSIDSNGHFFSGTPAQWADLVKYISVLTAHSP